MLDLADLLGDPHALVVVAVFDFARQHRTLSAEMGQAVRAENPRGEEGVDQGDQAVLADVLPFAVADRLGRAVAIRGAVAAGVIGRLAFAGATLHPQRVVAGGAVDDAAQEVGAFLRATAATAVAVAAALHLGLCALELLVGDQGLVALVRFDPFIGAAANHRPDALLVGA
ncbi:MAG TPA: hypothetical protein VN522_09695 [Solirubrobacterales bacterium]|nr:hypothetical protein [Solirubrobacterales bacterium]